MFVKPVFIVFLYFLLTTVYQKFVINKELAQNYYVNLNTIFDIDEPFLFENVAFWGLIKKVVTYYPHLISPNYDLGEIEKEENLYFQ